MRSEPRLVKKVVLSRHGVRSPTQHPDVLNQWAQKGWPQWPVKPGYLTDRGGELVKALWKEEGKSWRNRGMLSSKGCSQKIWVLADIDERTRKTADAILMGLEPECTPKYHVNDSLHIDPLFHPVKAGICKTPDAKALAEIKQNTKDLSDLDVALAAPMHKLAEIVGPADPTWCKQNKQKAQCSFNDVPSRLHADKKTSEIKLDGRLKIASSITEILLLEYAQWPDRLPGWNQVDKQTLQSLFPLHARVFDVTTRTPAIASSIGSALLSEMLKALNEKSENPEINQANAVFFVGHDTNIAAVGGILDIDWQLEGYARQQIPPGSALVLSVWERNGNRKVTAEVIAESVDALRQDPSQPTTIVRQFLKLPACGNAKVCPVERFTNWVENRLRNDCLTAR